MLSVIEVHHVHVQNPSNSNKCNVIAITFSCRIHYHGISAISSAHSRGTNATQVKSIHAVFSVPVNLPRVSRDYHGIITTVSIAVAAL